MEGKMKAIVKSQSGPGAELKEVDIPKIKPNEALVKVKATSICGTDVHIYTWDDWAASRIKPEMIFGHEFSGEVVEVGSEVTNVKVGDHVSAETHIICNECHQCQIGQYHVCQNTEILGVDRNGVFAEYVAIPATNLWKNDRDLPFEIASIQEPMGNAVHTLLSGEVTGKNVVVIGAGPIGIMAAATAKAIGAKQVIITDINDYRLKLAEKMGATITINSSEVDPVKEVYDITDGNGADVVLEMSGHPVAIQQGFKMLTFGGRISMLGLPSKSVEIDITNDIVFKGATIHGITGRKIFETWQQVSGLLKSGAVDLNPIITHTLPLEEFEKGFELMISGKSGKVVLIP
ncbi:L-threonine 3-dehydrogenase [Vulcanibacillus modesticaldus]|uniref:L-threonine 3-dehydrogenase n=1 Tax=Vulcanibacillus modesticaldus TaxID=337097 RepID=A0A1D2YXS1_9BACI|nr:L-threonine 3-dehydrogenase [Vulcanibacillus modesticaldus]OEG00483.1 L-threonine 3-dehydrogenase [Vulcanibacillus modesticaldus]